MPRQARIDAPVALRDVMVRGIESASCSRDDLDRAHFVARLASVVGQ